MHEFNESFLFFVFILFCFLVCFIKYGLMADNTFQTLNLKGDESL